MRSDTKANGMTTNPEDTAPAPFAVHASTCATCATTIQMFPNLELFDHQLCDKGVILYRAESPTTAADAREREAAIAFKKWWAAKVAEGYQYGRGPLATVRFGFEAGFAAALPAIQSTPIDAAVLAKEIYDALAVNDDVNIWHATRVLPMIEQVITTHLQPTTGGDTDAE